MVDSKKKDKWAYVTTADGFDEVEGRGGADYRDGTEDGLDDIGRKCRTRTLEERITVVVCPSDNPRQFILSL